MKKIIYSLGLSVLLSYPSWAQEQVSTEISAEPSTMSEEDAQTIFFSEDFLNDLTADNDEVQIFNDIPLDKSSLKNKEEPKNSLQNSVIDNEKANTQPQPVLSQPKDMPQKSAEQEQDAPLQQNFETPQAKTITNQQKISESASAEQSTPSQPEASAPQMQEKTLPSPIASKDANQPKAEPAPVQIKNEEKVQEVTDLQTQAPNVSEVEQKPQPVTEPKTEQKPITQESQISENKSAEESTAEVSDKAPVQSAQPENRPTIQELIQEKMPPVSKEEAIAPSKPERNAFSLDDSAPLPKNMLSDDALSTNMLNRGIRISPEQRARMMMKKKYTEMDLNQDGIITKAEFIRYKTVEAQRIANQVFKQIDTNADNILSAKEYDVLMNKMIENYIKNLQK